jgi:hypothetical protein
MKMGIDNSSKKNILKGCWIEVLKIVILSKSFDFMSTVDLKNLANKIKHDVNPKNFNILLTYEEKIQLLEYLVNSSFDFGLVRDSIKETLDKKAELKRRKFELEGELRELELKMKEISMENIETIRENINSLTESINNYLEENPGLSRQEATRKKKELESEREKKRESLKELDNYQEKCHKIFIQIEKLKEEILTVGFQTKKFLGFDVYRNEYYVRFFIFY